MRSKVYNSAISNVIANLVNCALRPAGSAGAVVRISLLVMGFAVAARAVDWNIPEQQLARKIVAVTGPAPVALTVENRSSLEKRDSEIIQNGLRSVLENLGLHFVKAEQSAATITISLSENPTAYVWIAEIHQGAGESALVMVSVPRPEGSITVHDSVPLSLRKIALWNDEDEILDVAVLEEGSGPTYIAVLNPEKVSLYRLQGGKWQTERNVNIAHARPWPRDLRGRMIPGRDHVLDVYLPGVVCHSTATAPLTLNCRESDDPWPLVPAGASGGMSPVFPSAGSSHEALPGMAPMAAFFAPARNFFTGALTPSVGKFAAVSKFYSAAPLPRDKYTLWLFAATDGQVHMVDGVSDQAAKLGWGSDLTSVRTACGAGWQVLATSAAEGSGDSVRAYEFPDRDPVAVSAAVDFTGEITALWTEAKGDTAIAVARDRETGSYEAFRLALACNQ